MEHGKPVNDNPTPRMALSIDQLPAIDVTAAFASSGDFDAIVMSAHEQGALRPQCSWPGSAGA